MRRRSVPGSLAHDWPRTAGIANPSGAGSPGASTAATGPASDRCRAGPTSDAERLDARRGSGI